MKFKVEHCQNTQCLYKSSAGRHQCFLDGKFIFSWLEKIAYLAESSGCPIHKQVKIYKTRELLRSY